MRARIQACARSKQAIDKGLHEAGATYLAGTATPSFGVVPGGGLHGELHLLQTIGLTSREALAAATSNLADTFRLSDRGRLEAGRRADLIMLTEDPRRDVGAVDAISEVMVAGRLVDREALLQRARAARLSETRGTT
jgi:imidazolonepropionase-like amidohydrolase